MNLLRAIAVVTFFTVNSFSQTFLGGYTGHQVSGNAIRVFADTASLNFIFYKSDIVRVDYYPSPSTQIDSSFIVVQDTIEVVNYSVDNLTTELIIETTNVKIVCEKFPVRIFYYNSTGEQILAEPPAGGVANLDNERHVNFILDPDDHFYGTGERGTDLDKRGQSFSSFNTQIGGYNSALSTMNINIPFLANSNGYALYFDNTYPGWFDFGDENPGKFYYKAFGGEMSYYLLVAETIPAQLEKYTWLTGRQPLPPRWALGYIQSKYGYRNENDARSMVQTMRQKEIPCDAIILDLYWFEHMGDIAWDFVNWPNPFTMMQDFLNDGIKTINITEPYIVEYSSNFQTAYNNGYLTFNSQGQPYLIPGWWSCGGCNAGLLDITNPDAQQWWWNKHPAFFGNELAGIWTDLGEPEAHPELMNHHLGSRDKVHNIFNFLWAELIFNGINQIHPNKRVFNLTRSGFAGIQRFGVIPWSGDVAKHFGGLKVQLPMLLNMGMSGLGYHHSDIGGFCCGITTPELYVRWMQYGTFCPVTRAHGIDNIQPTEPWGFGTEAEQISKKYIELRYKLLPYIYTMAYENCKTGIPLARPLLFDYPEVTAFNNYSDAYMWGSSILVAPVVDENHITKNISFPVGEWIDFYADNVITGGGSYVVQAPLDKLPLFVKRGSIIPMQPVMNYTDEFILDTLFLEIYPAQFSDASFSLYEDDGISLDYQSGSFAITELAQSITPGDELMVDIGASTGNFDGKLAHKIYLSGVHHMGVKPSVVLLNDNPIPERLSYQQLRNNENGFYYDGAKRKLYVQFKGSTDSSYQIKAIDIVLNNEQIKEMLPEEFVLYQNYPNPFNSTTNIKFTIGIPPNLPKGEAYVGTSFMKFYNITLKIYDILGREIATLVNKESAIDGAGEYGVEWNASGLPSGIYFYQLRTGTFVQTKKMVYLK